MEKWLHFEETVRWWRISKVDDETLNLFIESLGNVSSIYLTFNGGLRLIPNDVIKIFKYDWKIECISVVESALSADTFQSTNPIQQTPSLR